MKTTRFEKSLARGEMPRMIELIDVASHVTRRSDYERLMREVFELHAHRDGRMPVFGGAASSAALSHAPAGGLVAGASADVDCAGADGAAPEVAQDDDDGDGDGDPDSDRHRPPHPSPRALLCNAAIPTGAKPNPSSSADCELWRLPVVLQKIPVSKSGWFAGVRAGRYPKPVKLGARAVAWRAVDIRALVASL